MRHEIDQRLKLDHRCKGFSVFARQSKRGRTNEPPKPRQRSNPTTIDRYGMDFRVSRLAQPRQAPNPIRAFGSDHVTRLNQSKTKRTDFPPRRAQPYPISITPQRLSSAIVDGSGIALTLMTVASLPSLNKIGWSTGRMVLKSSNEFRVAIPSEIVNALRMSASMKASWSPRIRLLTKKTSRHSSRDIAPRTVLPLHTPLPVMGRKTEVRDQSGFGNRESEANNKPATKSAPVRSRDILLMT